MGCAYMKFRPLRALFAAFALLTAGPALAQNFSDGYEFLKAVRAEDGTKIMTFLREPGNRVIESRDPATGETALHIVTKARNDVYLRFFLQQDGVNPNAQDRQGNSAMLLAVNGNFPEGVAILIRYRANVNIANSSGETPLIRAVQLRNVDMVRVLLAANANPDQPDTIAGMSARDYAMQDTRSPTIRRLLTEAPRGGGTGNVAGPGL